MELEFIGKLSKVFLDNISFSINYDGEPLPFYIWGNENITINTDYFVSSARIHRVNFNLNEYDLAKPISIDLASWKVVAKNNQYLTFESEKGNAYLVCDMLGSLDVCDDVKAQINNKVIVNCDYAKNTLSYKIQCKNDEQQHSIVLDFWIILVDTKNSAVVKWIDENISI